MNKDLSSLPVGTVLKGKYRIKSHLSSGGFGKTYLAEYGSRKTKVAIKEFFMNTANQREADGVTVSVDPTKENADAFSSQFAKFKKEYERLKLIDNVHVVKVHECFEENGTAYYVMDFVEGDDLKEILEQRHKPFTEKKVLNYLEQVLDGLAAIHGTGLLHLDIKPSNLMVTRYGYIKLIDLGASKDYRNGEGSTVFSSVAQTDRYAPSEQIDGSYSKLGPWTDFYALGATLFRLLTCHDIPTGTELKEDKTGDKQIALPMHNVSAETKLLIVWLMEVDREKRPQSVAEILERIKPVKKQHRYGETTMLPNTTDEATVLPDWHQKPAQPSSSQNGQKCSHSKKNKTSAANAADFDTAMYYYNKGLYDTAFPLLERLANSGNVDAMFRLGVCYYWDEGIESSIPRSINRSQCADWMQRAADLGNSDAMLWLGAYLYGNGVGVEKDEAKAEEYIRKAVAAGNYSAMVYLAVDYLDEDSQLLATGFEGLLKASFLSREEMNLLAFCFDYGCGTDIDMEQALRGYKKSADLGDPESQNRLGEIYWEGDGVPENECTAFTFFQMSANKNYTCAMANIALCYYYGYGTIQDYSKSLEWCRKTIDEGGGKEVLTLMGLFFQNGYVVEKNYRDAEACFLKAIDETYDSTALNGLGEIYEEGGYGINKDLEKSARYYKQAALKDCPIGQYNYGRALLEGNGVSVDTNKGMVWINKAADADCQQAIDFLDSFDEEPEPSPIMDAPPEEKDKFSFVGCLYILIINAIMVLIVKFLFFT